MLPWIQTLDDYFPVHVCVDLHAGQALSQNKCQQWDLKDILFQATLSAYIIGGISNSIALTCLHSLCNNKIVPSDGTERVYRLVRVYPCILPHHVDLHDCTLWIYQRSRECTVLHD